MRSGQAKALTVISQPAIIGLAADARLRGTAVMLAAAARSGGVTIAMTYEVRVGTSIWDSAARTSSNAMTVPRSPVNGTRMTQILDGICVNTMVLTRPIRLAMRAATG